MRHVAALREENKRFRWEITAGNELIVHGPWRKEITVARMDYAEFCKTITDAPRLTD